MIKAGITLKKLHKIFKYFINYLNRSFVDEIIKILNRFELSIKTD